MFEITSHISFVRPMENRDIFLKLIVCFLQKITHFLFNCSCPEKCWQLYSFQRNKCFCHIRGQVFDNCLKETPLFHTIFSHLIIYSRQGHQTRALTKSGTLIMMSIHESFLCRKLNKYLAGQHSHSLPESLKFMIQK